MTRRAFFASLAGLAISPVAPAVVAKRNIADVSDAEYIRQVTADLSKMFARYEAASRPDGRPPMLFDGLRGIVEDLPKGHYIAGSSRTTYPRLV